MQYRMMAHQSWLHVGLAQLLVNFFSNLPRTSAVVISTYNGNVQGFSQTIGEKSVNTFLGIPFAEPPVGPLRFRLPEPVKNWTGTYEALTAPNSCVQTTDTSFNTFKGVAMWNPNTNMSEDCLYLNIWAPTRSSEKLATLVWIYGGGFILGTSTLDIYDGRYLAAQNNVIVASMNYRLGPFGFSYLGTDEIPGNMGLWDQNMALQWLYNNVEQFGGDKDKITLFGESAGSSSVSYHLLSQHSWPYFNNAILQSGSFLADWAYMLPEVSAKRTRELAKNLNCDVSTDARVARCLKDAGGDVLAEKQWDFYGTFISSTFGPTTDGHFISDTPHNLLTAGKIKDTQILCGVVKDEGTYFMVYGLQEFYQPDDLWAPKSLNKSQFLAALYQTVNYKNDYVKDAILFEYESSNVPSERASYTDIIDDIGGDYEFKCPTIDLARSYLENSDSPRLVYMYSFNHITSFNPWPKWMGVMHGYELDSVFGQPFGGDWNYTEEEKDLSSDIMQYFSNFAKSGDPNRDESNSSTELTWPNFTVESQSYMILDVGSKKMVGHGLRHRQCAFWREMVPMLERINTETDEKEEDKDTSGCRSHFYRPYSVISILLISCFLLSLV